MEAQTEKTSKTSDCVHSIGMLVFIPSQIKNSAQKDIGNDDEGGSTQDVDDRK